jgi:hypothetical protein
VLKKAHIPYILACHLQIDPDPAYHFDADPIADSAPYFYLMRMRIRNTAYEYADPNPTTDLD